MYAKFLQYPVYSIPPIMFQAGSNVGAKLQCADEITAQAMQAVVSAAVQSIIEVDVPVFGRSATNLWLLTVAESTEGKDVVKKFVMAGFQRFANEIIERDRTESMRNAVALDMWSAERDGLKTRLRRQVVRGENIEEIKQLLTEHHLKKPVEMMSHCLSLDIFDAKALVISLAKQSKYMFVDSTEGSTIFNSKAIKNLPAILKTYSGESIVLSHGTPNPKTYSVNGALTTMSVMIQPKPLSDLLKDKQELLIGSGFLPRFLPAYPSPQRGRRFIVDQLLNSDGLDAFNNRVYDVLSEAPYFKDRNDKKITMIFSPQARLLWIDVRNAIEASMAPGGAMFSVPEFAGRLANNAARMAANWQFFQHGNAEISAETLSAALEVCKWHAIEFVRIFSDEAQMPVPERDAVTVEQFLSRRYQQYSTYLWPVQDLNRHVPRPIRGNKLRLMAALLILQRQGKVFITRNGSCEMVQYLTYYNTQQTSSSQQALLSSV